MSKKRDCYDVLGIARDASDTQIKKAYRKLAMKYHPDKNPGDKAAEEKFKEATECYEILSNTDLHQRYDQFGWDAFERGGGRGGGGGFGGMGNIDLEEAMNAFASAFGGGGMGGGSFFESLFGGMGGGGGGSRDAHTRGSDLRYDLEIDFEEAAFGSKRELTLNIVEDCKACQGSGADDGSKRETCSKCGGTGEIIRHPCRACGGQGRIKAERTIGLNIPAGVDTGSRMRLAGKGEGGTRGGAPGDLFVVLHVKEHDLFQRDGMDTFCEVPIPFHIAALGGEVQVPTLRGDVPLKIPEGTQPNKRFTLRGLGLPSVRSSRSMGDHIITVTIEVPTGLPRKADDLLAAFGASLKENHHPRLSALRKRAARFFKRKESIDAAQGKKENA